MEVVAWLCRVEGLFLRLFRPVRERLPALFSSRDNAKMIAIAS